MKKRIAFLLGLFLMLTVAFAACSQPAATAKYIRVNESETHVFKITLSDFADDGQTLFKTYTQKFNQKNEDDTITETTVTAKKDEIITSGEASLMSGADQLRPVDASGTYKMTVQYNATTITLITEQTLYSQYETATLQDLGCLELLKDLNVTAKEENPFTNNDGRTTLRSVTKSSVTFASNANQLPESSTSENNGFYIGKLAQTVSNYKYETTYDFENKKITVKKNGGEAVEKKLSGNCIDANQFLMYIRSFDKSSAAFQDNPTVSVYDVTTDKTYSAAFALNRQFYLLYDNNGEEAIFSVNAVTSTVGGVPFVAQYNLPDLTSIGEGGSDCLQAAGTTDKLCKYTTVKFRSGWYSYELQPDETMQQTVNAIKLKNEA